METTNKLAKEEKEEDEEKKKSERRMKKGMKKGMRKVDEYQQIRQEACCDCRCTEPATLLAGPGLSFAEPHSRMEIIRKDAENCVESLALVHWCALLDKADKHMDSATRGIRELRSGMLPDACNCAAANHFTAKNILTPETDPCCHSHVWQPAFYGQNRSYEQVLY